MQKILDWIGWIAVMHGPSRLTVTADNPVGRWCLPRAGRYAYSDLPDCDEQEAEQK